MSSAFDPSSKRLKAVTRLVRILEAGLERGDFHGHTSAAHQLVEATTRLLDELRHDPAIDVELTAALQVYRNAAFAFRRLAVATEENNIAIASACATLIEQGNDHFQRFILGSGRGHQK